MNSGGDGSDSGGGVLNRSSVCLRQMSVAAGGGRGRVPMLEVNPLAETADGLLMSADAKLNFDDNASFRQKDIFALRDTSQEVRSRMPWAGATPKGRSL